MSGHKPFVIDQEALKYIHWDMWANVLSRWLEKPDCPFRSFDFLMCHPIFWSYISFNGRRHRITCDDGFAEHFFSHYSGEDGNYRKAEATYSIPRSPVWYIEVGPTYWNSIDRKPYPGEGVNVSSHDQCLDVESPDIETLYIECARKVWEKYGSNRDMIDRDEEFVSVFKDFLF